MVSCRAWTATARDAARNIRDGFPLELGPTGRCPMQVFTLHLQYSKIRAKIEIFQGKFG
jgi:hypothetical protein